MQQQGLCEQMLLKCYLINNVNILRLKNLNTDLLLLKCKWVDF